MILLQFFYCLIAIVMAALWFAFIITGRAATFALKLLAIAFILFSVFSLAIGIIFL